MLVHMADFATSIAHAQDGSGLRGASASHVNSTVGTECTTY